MKTLKNKLSALAAIVCASLIAQTSSAGEMGFMLDDFSAAETTSVGTPRIVVDDSSVGGKSQMAKSVVDGVLSASGTITPARGQPGWVSMTLLATPDGAGKDLSAYKGIRMRIRIQKGMISVSANSTKVDNFDYHSAIVPSAKADYSIVDIPFASLKRNWSEQTMIDPATIGSVSVVAFGVQATGFAYDIDEIGFY